MDATRNIHQAPAGSPTLPLKTRKTRDHRPRCCIAFCDICTDLGASTGVTAGDRKMTWINPRIWHCAMWVAS